MRGNPATETVRRSKSEITVSFPLNTAEHEHSTGLEVCLSLATGGIPECSSRTDKVWGWRMRGNGGDHEALLRPASVNYLVIC